MKASEVTEITWSVSRFCPIAVNRWRDCSVNSLTDKALLCDVLRKEA